MVTDLSNWSEEQEVEDEHEDASQGNKEDSSKDTEVESEQFNQENKIVSPQRGSRIRRIPERFNDYLLNSAHHSLANNRRLGPSLRVPQLIGLKRGTAMTGAGEDSYLDKRRGP
ncbi:hypothetical protein J6590_061281 [Homalodisca vitripennis]|nr:hypothetical protein J6590_061281 [Homalodisca vitripennis]